MKNIIIEKLLGDHQRFHSEFQIRNFIIGSAGNSWAMYKQCLREIDSRMKQIKMIENDIELIEIDLKDLNRFRWFGWFNKFNRDRRALRSKIKRRDLLEKRDEIGGLERELNVFVEIASDLYKNKYFAITTADRNRLEAKSWIHKALTISALEIMTGGGLTRSTMEFILSLPDNERREVLDAIHPSNANDLIAWVKGYHEKSDIDRNITESKDSGRIIEGPEDFAGVERIFKNHNFTKGGRK